MDPRKLFVDERLTGFCVYCGNDPSTKDHVPSKVLLDEPYPPQLPVVPACEACNASFALDEQYLACLVECVVTGSTVPDTFQRDKIRRILHENSALVSRLANCRHVDGSGEIVWKPELDRVKNVVLKLARGHVAYELSEPQLDEPEQLSFVPFVAMSEAQRQAFESLSMESSWPEIGSRTFLRATEGWSAPCGSVWLVVQDRRYRYSVAHSGLIVVRVVLSEYLACEVVW